MAYWPLNARSELVTPLNFSDGCVFDTTRRFHDASWAFISPALSPTLGSGLGATVDMLLPPPDAQAASVAIPTASDHARIGCPWRTTDSIVGSSLWTKRMEASLAVRPEQQRGQHALHAIDLGRLVGVHVGREPEDHLLFPRSRAEQLIDHRDGAAVVLDHELQEEPVEVGPPRLVQLRQLLRGQHPRHDHRRVHAAHTSHPRHHR